MGKFVHGLKKTRRYETWCGMKKRCYNKNCSRYKDYGGRGIVVCAEWEHDFRSFYFWSERNGYQNDLTIDRINNDGDYTPNNCRWVTNQQNCNNGRHQRKVFINGNTTTIRDLSNEFGLTYKTIRSRIDRGLSGDDLIKSVGFFIRPPRKRNSLGQFI